MMTQTKRYSEEVILPEALRAFQGDVALVLGSGLGGFVDRLVATDVIPFSAIEGLPLSGVPGHEGRFVLGRLGETKLIVVQGRVHLYEGWSARAVTANVRLLAAAGVRHLVLTNAAGSLNARFPPGQWMLVADQLNLTGQSPLTGGPHFHEMSGLYDAQARDRFKRLAETLGMPLHEGVYAGLSGPQYETPAEIRMLKGFGADAVGMSTVLEAIQAYALGLRVTGFSCLTNWGAGLSDTAPTHAEVLGAAEKASDQLLQLFQHYWAG